MKSVFYILTVFILSLSQAAIGEEPNSTENVLQQLKTLNDVEEQVTQLQSEVCGIFSGEEARGCNEKVSILVKQKAKEYTAGKVVEVASEFVIPHVSICRSYPTEEERNDCVVKVINLINGALTLAAVDQVRDELFAEDRLKQEIIDTQNEVCSEYTGFELRNCDLEVAYLVRLAMVIDKQDINFFHKK